MSTRPARKIFGRPEEVVIRKPRGGVCSDEISLTEQAPDSLRPIHITTVFGTTRYSANQKGCIARWTQPLRTWMPHAPL